MRRPVWDQESGDVLYPISDNMAMSADGDLMLRMSDNMAMDMDSGELRFTSPWADSNNDES